MPTRNAAAVLAGRTGAFAHGGRATSVPRWPGAPFMMAGPPPIERIMDGAAAITASANAAAAAERTTLVLGKAMRQERDQAAALVQLLDQPQAPPPVRDGVGRHVNYRA